MKNNFEEKKGQRNRGYALLFSVLVAAVVLGVGISILNIAKKEILLTSSATQSQYAFYAADTGYECALYEDLQAGIFSATTSSEIQNPFPLISCGSIGAASYSSAVTASYTSSGVNMSELDYSFNIPVSNASGACSEVILKKIVINNTISSTTILSDGFNAGAEGFTGSGAGDCNGYVTTTKVERSLLANY